LAALDPIPLPRGRFLVNSMAIPWLEPAAFRYSLTATPAVFRSASAGSLPPSPVIEVITTPGSSLRVRVTSSQGDSTANPKMSNPQDTLATVAGAVALIEFMIGLFIVVIGRSGLCV